MVEPKTKEPYSGLNHADNKPCSICGKNCKYKFKHGFVCEDCFEYVTLKIRLKDSASNPASNPEKY